MTDIPPAPAFRPARLRVDPRGFIYADGVMICRRVPGGLEFCDKDKRRASERGSRLVVVRLDDLRALDTDVEGPPPPLTDGVECRDEEDNEHATHD